MGAAGGGTPTPQLHAHAGAVTPPGTAARGPRRHAGVGMARGHHCAHGPVHGGMHVWWCVFVCVYVCVHSVSCLCLGCATLTVTSAMQEGCGGGSWCCGIQLSSCVHVWDARPNGMHASEGCTAICLCTNTQTS